MVKMASHIKIKDKGNIDLYIHIVNTFFSDVCIVVDYGKETIWWKCYTEIFYSTVFDNIINNKYIW